MNLIHQKHARGCGPAALAMVTGHDYDDVCRWFAPTDFESRGIYLNGAFCYLVEHGFAIQPKYQFLSFFLNPDGSNQAVRESWPVTPFADRHLVDVRVAEDSPCNHFVAMNRAGEIYDPIFGVGRQLSDYSRVHNITGIWPL